MGVVDVGWHMALISVCVVLVVKAISCSSVVPTVIIFIKCQCFRV